MIGFLLGAEFDVLAFLIKRYYGNVAYGRIYGVIFGVFYLGSAVGIWGLPKTSRAVGRSELRQRPLRRGRHLARFGGPDGVHAEVPLRRRPRSGSPLAGTPAAQQA